LKEGFNPLLKCSSPSPESIRLVLVSGTGPWSPMPLILSDGVPPESIFHQELMNYFRVLDLPKEKLIFELLLVTL
jgi:hypothetical protein